MFLFYIIIVGLVVGCMYSCFFTPFIDDGIEWIKIITGTTARKILKKRRQEKINKIKKKHSHTHRGTEDVIKEKRSKARAEDREKRLKRTIESDDAGDFHLKVSEVEKL